MFFGEFEHTLDEKNRLILPSRFRDVFACDVPARFFMTRGFDKCLALYLEKDWLAEIKKIQQRPYQQSEVRKFQRLLYSRTTEVTLDKQGRLLIPEKFKLAANIQKDVVSVGIDNKIEIWDQEQWQAFNQDHHQEFETIAEHLFDSGLNS